MRTNVKLEFEINICGRDGGWRSFLGQACLALTFLEELYVGTVLEPGQPGLHG
jgi:hypothetical protein